MYQNLKSLKEKEIKLGGGLSKMVKEFGTLCIAGPERKGRVMLIIKIGGEVLTYNMRQGKWVCSDRVLEQVCNNMLPEGRMSHGVIFIEEGGPEGFVLRYMEEIWDDDLEVIAYDPDPPPESEEGIVY